MNLPRLRELLKAWQDGSIREAELLELRDALPEVIEAAGRLTRYEGHCSRCDEDSTAMSPLVVDGPDNSRVCLDCFGDVIGEFAAACAACDAAP